MALLDQIASRHDRMVRNANPVPPREAQWASEFGHRDDFGPPEYGDYIATSNDIYSLVTFRARLLASLKMKAYQGRDVDKQPVTDGLVVDLLRKVNPFWTFSRLLRMTETCMGLWGEGMWVAERGETGLRQPQELWWVKPTRMHPVPHPTDYISGWLYEPVDGSEPIPFQADEVIWFRYPNPLDQYAGLSPLAAARLSADTASSMMKSNRNLFTNGMQSAGIVAPPKGVTFDQDQAEVLQDKLEERLQGVDKAHRIAVLRFEAQMQQLSITPKDAEFVAGLNMTFRQSARAYGVPTPLLNDTENATLTNVREYQRALWEHTLIPEAQFYTDELEEQLLPMFRVGRGAPREPDHLEFDTSQIPALQEARTAVWGRERQQIEAGAITINEWRNAHGMPDVPWGDQPWIAVNRQQIDEDGTRPQDTNGERVDTADARLLLDELHLSHANGHSRRS